MCIAGMQRTALREIGARSEGRAIEAGVDDCEDVEQIGAE